jgi:ABC-2 type transport system permease protein
VQLAAVGFVCAWRVSSTQGFHAVMNLLLMPLWLLSGAFFPPSAAPGWLAAVMRANPLTYGVAAFSGALHGATAAAGLPALGVSLAATAVFTVAAVALAWVTAKSGGVR